tara:strand:+ start:258 stop:443 length:186 start_codon:yes stop_codon:yes gene_type:complete
MLILKLWAKISRGRRLNIKRVILFSIIVYAAYVLMDSFLPLLVVGFVVWLLYNWSAKDKFW